MTQAQNISEDDATEAAEYVLGLSGAEDRRRFEARMAGSAALQAEVAAWDEDLIPLVQNIPVLDPPEGCESTLSLRLFGVVDTPEPVIETKTVQSGFWKWFSGAALALAVAAVLYIFGERQEAARLQPQAPTSTLAAPN